MTTDRGVSGRYQSNMIARDLIGFARSMALGVPETSADAERPRLPYGGFHDEQGESKVAALLISCVSRFVVRSSARDRQVHTL
jgi:hypothetical protein